MKNVVIGIAAFVLGVGVLIGTTAKGAELPTCQKHLSSWGDTLRDQGYKLLKGKAVSGNARYYIYGKRPYVRIVTLVVAGASEERSMLAGLHELKLTYSSETCTVNNVNINVYVTPPTVLGAI